MAKSIPAGEAGKEIVYSIKYCVFRLCGAFRLAYIAISVVATRLAHASKY